MNSSTFFYFDTRPGDALGLSCSDWNFSGSQLSDIGTKCQCYSSEDTEENVLWEAEGLYELVT